MTQTRFLRGESIKPDTYHREFGGFLHWVFEPAIRRTGPPSYSAQQGRMYTAAALHDLNYRGKVSEQI